MLLTEDEIAAFIERTIDEKLRERDTVRVTLDSAALHRAVTVERRRRARYGAP